MNMINLFFGLVSGSVVVIAIMSALAVTQLYELNVTFKKINKKVKK